MNPKLKSILRNSSYAISSNLISLLISSLVILILPNLIGVEDYGYWQLYLFYVNYIGFAHLGWIDGIYLRYGGEYYEELEIKKFYSQFIMFALMQAVIALTIFIGSLALPSRDDKGFIFSTIAITLLFTNLRFFIIYILQTTNRIKDSSRITILDRIIYLILLTVLILFGARNYQTMIWVDIIARFLSLFFGIYLCRNIIFRRFSLFEFDLQEVFSNIVAGSNLMFSNIASMLIIGTVRLGIEYRWDVATFGKISLTLSISNLIMIFINAVGIVIFPMLKRMKEEYLAEVYISLRDLLMVGLLSVLLLYFPLRVLLNQLLPAYNDSLKFMALVFPMSLFEGKMALLINTYLKALRREKDILRVNIVSMCLSFMMTFLSTILLKNLEFSITSIVLLLFFRCLLAELKLSKLLGISVIKDALTEGLMAIIFIIAGWFFNLPVGLILYFIAYVFYVLLKRKVISESVQSLKTVLN
ncbi:oligosaccharide flippase family protein [Streptococcus ovuberis]|uniref:Oligosaccharide flippase family protein n=1 Tax=Streptococcus ovuberis TaxID=1936207 RepID=A0A7X6MVW6_9STRE|nr:oligosaccharide flippase family protein [Streptococcus ovuberis]NKZ19377.1 oligosaccharide flippase family protein [Streptococcus ovuberis]